MTSYLGIGIAVTPPQILKLFEASYRLWQMRRLIFKQKLNRNIIFWSNFSSGQHTFRITQALAHVQWKCYLSCLYYLLSVIWGFSLHFVTICLTVFGTPCTLNKDQKLGGYVCSTLHLSRLAFRARVGLRAAGRLTKYLGFLAWSINLEGHCVLMYQTTKHLIVTKFCHIDVLKCACS